MFFYNNFLGFFYRIVLLFLEIHGDVLDEQIIKLLFTILRSRFLILYGDGFMRSELQSDLLRFFLDMLFRCKFFHQKVIHILG